MSELLSQDEINALLSAFDAVNAPSTGGPDRRGDRSAREVRLYDFAKPDRFSKDHLRVLHQVHTNFATGVASTLSGLYQMPVRVDMVGLDQVPYKEYRSSVPAKTLFAEVIVEPLSTDILFEMNPSIVGSLVDCLCGGNPAIPAGPSELTPVDLRIAQKVLEMCVRAYTDAWAGMVSLKASVRGASDSSTYDEVFLSTETVLVCCLEVHIGQSTGMMTVCIPAAGIEAVLPLLTAARAGRNANRRMDKAVSEGIKRFLKPVSLPCRVVLGSTSVRFGDAMRLEVGDVITTGTPADGELEMMVGNRCMFRCRPGIRARNLAVVVSSVVTDTDFSTGEQPHSGSVEHAGRRVA